MRIISIVLINLLVFCSVLLAQENRNLEREKAGNAKNGPRIALVIGNGAYATAPALKNPPNDARDMASTLKTLGFDVTSGINISQREMKRLIREFGQKLKAGGSGLFYYAGHGVQSKGRNYLIPIDADIQSEADVEDTGIDLSLVLNNMDEAANGLNIVILDACRNNPFARSFRSATNGLAQVDAPTGTLIAYATAPGTVASDGMSQNGLYTAELLKQMLVQGQNATDMFMRVRAEVMKKTESKQVPWEASSLTGAFYFSSQANIITNETAAEKRADPAAFELSYWDTIKTSTDPEDFKAYLAKYPNGQFADLARRRIGKPASSDGATNTAAAQYIKSGDELASARKWSDAEVDYKLAARLDPANVETHNKLGFVLHALLKFAEAEIEYRVALRLAPNNADSHYGISRSLREQKKLAEAESELREALRIEPNNPKFHAAYGYTLGHYEHKYVESEAELGQAIRLEPNDVEWHAVLADILYEEKKYGEAAAEARETVRISPNVSLRRSYLAEILLNEKKYAEGEKEAREAVRLDPKNAYGQWALGTSLSYQNKDLPAAEAALHEAVRLLPDSSPFHQNLGVVLQKLGKQPEADFEFRVAKDLDPVTLMKQIGAGAEFKAAVTTSVEGTTWKGTSPGGDKQYEFHFLSGGEFRSTSIIANVTFRSNGTWKQVGNTVSIDDAFDFDPQKHYLTEAAINQNTMQGGSADGKYKFIMKKVD